MAKEAGQLLEIYDWRLESGDLRQNAIQKADGSIIEPSAFYSYPNIKSEKLSTHTPHLWGVLQNNAP